MGLDSKIETQVSTVFPNPMVDYLDYVYDDLEMSRSHFIRKTAKENLKEYETNEGKRKSGNTSLISILV